MLDDDNIQESISKNKLSDADIFTKIWTSPRLVFKFLNDFDYDKYVTILLVFAGITRAFDRAVTKNMGDDFSLISILSISIILGGLFGWITFYIYAAMMSWTGKWLKGRGNTKSLLRVVAHAMTPSIVALVLLVPQIILFGNGIFQSDIDLYGNGLVPTIFLYAIWFLEITLGLYTIVIFVIGISEVQKLSIGKSILNLVLPGLVILGPIIIIVFIVNLFR
jgi:hypothetical protein